MNSTLPPVLPQNFQCVTQRVATLLLVSQSQSQSQSLLTMEDTHNV